MSEKETAVLDEDVTVSFKKSELFQLHLAVVSRNGYATQKWASAANADEQRQMQAEVEFLNQLDMKIVKILGELENAKN